MARNLGTVDPTVEARAGLEPLERAIAAFLAGRGEAAVTVYVEGARDQDLPISYLFRDGRRRTAFDRAAAAACRGRVLDVGAGAGALAAPLVRAGTAVTALEILPSARRALVERGVVDVRPTSVWAFDPAERWDTVVALMNGSTLAGTRARLGAFLSRLGALADRGGRVILDSTGFCEPDDRLPDGRFAGELHYEIEFDGERGPTFPQLFVPETVLASEAAELGWTTSIVHRDAAGRYLALLEPGRA